MIRVYQLGGIPKHINYTIPVGSEDFCFIDPDEEVYHLKAERTYNVGFLWDKWFRKPMKALRERRPMRQCKNLQVDGFIFNGTVPGCEFHVDDDGRLSFYYQNIFHINIWSDKGNYYRIMPNGGELRIWWQHHYIGKGSSERHFPMRFQVGVITKYSKDDHSYFCLLQSFVLDRDEHDPSPHRRMIVKLKNAEDLQYRSGDWKGLFSKHVRPWLVQKSAPTMIVSSSDTGRVILPATRFVDLASLLEVTDRIFQSGGFQYYIPNVDKDFDDHLFVKAVEKFRPTQLSWLETVEGYKELPGMIQSMIEGVSTIFGKKVPATMTITTLIGFYLMWIYAVKPMPEDLRIVSEWFKSYLSPARFDGKRLMTRDSYEVEHWTGWRQAAIQLRSSVDFKLTDPNQWLDAVESDHTLRAGDILSLNPSGAAGLEYGFAMLADVFPLTYGDALGTLWNSIGYSFVYDWFGNFVGGNTRSIGNLQYLQALPVVYGCRTIRLQRDCEDWINMIRSAPGLEDVSGAISAQYYERKYTDKVEIDPHRLFTHDEVVPTSGNQLVQGGCLLTQRLL